jgi:hypothetical protein
MYSLQPPADGKKLFSFLCKLEATDQDYAGNKWKPSGAAPAKHQPDWKWFALPDILAGRATGVASWVPDIVKKSQDNFQDRSHANSQAGPNARQHAGPGAGADAAANSNAQTYNKIQVCPPAPLPHTRWAVSVRDALKFHLDTSEDGAASEESPLEIAHTSNAASFDDSGII